MLFQSFNLNITKNVESVEVAERRAYNVAEYEQSITNEKQSFEIGKTVKDVVDILIARSSQIGDTKTVIKVLPLLAALQSETSGFDFSLFSKMAEMSANEEGWN